MRDFLNIIIGVLRIFNFLRQSVAFRVRRICQLTSPELFPRADDKRVASLCLSAWRCSTQLLMHLPGAALRYMGRCQGRDILLLENPGYSTTCMVVTAVTWIRLILMADWNSPCHLLKRSSGCGSLGVILHKDSVASPLFLLPQIQHRDSIGTNIGSVMTGQHP